MCFLLWSASSSAFPVFRFGVTKPAPGGCRGCSGSGTGSTWAEGVGEARRPPFGDKVTWRERVLRPHCFIGASNTKRREIGMRYEIGVDNLLWGSDFPHPEGTWPKSREWLSAPTTTSDRGDAPHARARPAEVFGFDVNALQRWPQDRPDSCRARPARRRPDGADLSVAGKPSCRRTPLADRS